MLKFEDQCNLPIQIVADCFDHLSQQWEEAGTGKSLKRSSIIHVYILKKY